MTIKTCLTPSGAIQLPIEVQSQLHWAPGIPLELSVNRGKVVVRSLEPTDAELDPAETSLEDLVGCLLYEGPALSLEDMEAGIAIGARGRR